MASVTPILLWIALLFAAVMTLDALWRRFCRRRSRRLLLESVGLLMLAALGAVLLGSCLPRWVASPALVFLRWPAVALYLALCVVYVEIQSLLARGYSLRILMDLLEADGTARVEDLKRRYGGGKGVRGLVRKRVEGLAAWRLIRWDGTAVGPLTVPGKLAASVSAAWRRLLRLERAE